MVRERTNKMNAEGWGFVAAQPQTMHRKNEQPAPGRASPRRASIFRGLVRRARYPLTSYETQHCGDQTSQVRMSLSLMGKNAAGRFELRFTKEVLRQIAVDIVTESQPCRPHYLQGRMKNEYGTSHREANETLFILMRDGGLKRTFWRTRAARVRAELGPPQCTSSFTYCSCWALIGFIVWIVSQ